MLIKNVIKVALLPLFMYSCTQANTAPTPSASAVAEVKVSSVSVDPKTLSLTEGDKASLTASVKLSDGTSNSEVTWSSSDKNVATINETGGVVGFAPGSATISATSKKDSKIVGNVSVTVVKKPAPPPPPEPSSYDVAFELDGILPRIEIDNGPILNLPLTTNLKPGKHTIKIYDLVKPCTNYFDITVDKDHTKFKYPCASGGN